MMSSHISIYSKYNTYYQIIMSDSKVLLVCVQNKRQINIKHDLIAQVFSKYGQVVKILIFEKALVWKVFLEYSTTSQAQQAQKNLNNSYLDEGKQLRMCIYESNHDKVVFQEYKQKRDQKEKMSGSNNSLKNESTDDEAIPTKNQILNYTNQSNQNLFNTIQFQQQFQLLSFEIQNASLKFMQLLMEVPNLNKKMLNQQWIQEFSQNIYGIKQQFFLQEQLIQNFHDQMLIQIQDYLLRQEQQFSKQLTISQITTIEELQEKNDKSRVITASPFDDANININMLVNLFSIYGNIEKMIFQKDSRTINVQYQLQKCADQCIQKLNQIKLFDQVIEVNYSTMSEIPDFELADIIEQIYEERFIGSEQTNRYKPKNSYIAAAPNDTIFIMNLPDEMMDITCFKNMLQNLKVVEYKFIEDPKQKHSCAIKFSNTEDAILFLARNHGLEVFGRKIIMTFSKKPVF
ncbi:hypothetical protein pb186bvf_007728 [Paramecium bursaria]